MPFFIASAMAHYIPGLFKWLDQLGEFHMTVAIVWGIFYSYIDDLYLFGDEL